jgi:hypothetical protein
VNHPKETENNDADNEDDDDNDKKLHYIRPMFSNNYVATFYNVSTISRVSWTVFTVELGFRIAFLHSSLLFHKSSVILVQVYEVY